MNLFLGQLDLYCPQLGDISGISFEVFLKVIRADIFDPNFFGNNPSAVEAIAMPDPNRRIRRRRKRSHQVSQRGELVLGFRRKKLGRFEKKRRGTLFFETCFLIS